MVTWSLISASCRPLPGNQDSLRATSSQAVGNQGRKTQAQLFKIHPNVQVSPSKDPLHRPVNCFLIIWSRGNDVGPIPESSSILAADVTNIVSSPHESHVTAGYVPLIMSPMYRAIGSGLNYSLQGLS